MARVKKAIAGYSLPVFSEIDPSNEKVNYHSTIQAALNYAKFALDSNELKRQTQLMYRGRKFTGLELWRFATVGKYAWIVNNGGTLSPESMSWLDIAIGNLEEISKGMKRSETNTNDAPQVDIQARTKEKLDEYIGEIEVEIDNFILTNKSDFVMYDWLKINDVAPLQATGIGEFYTLLKTELEMIPKDKELQEGYSHMSAKSRKAYIKFVTGIVDDCVAWAESKKRQRKQRKPKKKSVGQLVSKVKYLDESKEYKISSIAPENIIGAKQVWLFNTKTRALSKIESSTKDGLSIKGTTIQDFDDDLSQTKLVRKPLEVIPNVMSGGKIVLRKLMDGLTTKASKATGRINSDTIIMRAVK